MYIYVEICYKKGISRIGRGVVGGGGDWVLDAQRKAVASICPEELKIKLEFQLDLQTSSSPIVLALNKSSIKPFSSFVSNGNFLTRQENLVVPDDCTALIV